MSRVRHGRAGVSTTLVVAVILALSGSALGAKKRDDADSKPAPRPAATQRETKAEQRPAQPAPQPKPPKVAHADLPANIARPQGLAGPTNSAADIRELQKRYAQNNGTAPKVAGQPAPRPERDTDRRESPRDNRRDDRHDGRDGVFSSRAGFGRDDCRTPLVPSYSGLRDSCAPAVTPCGPVYTSSYCDDYRWRRYDSTYYYRRPSTVYYTPSTAYVLVDPDPDQAAVRGRYDAAGDSAYHAWQREVRQNQIAQEPDGFAPAPVTVSPPAAGIAPPQAPPGSISVSFDAAWNALREGRLLDAQSLLSQQANLTGAPGARIAAADQALLSAGYSLVASLLGREEAAAWAMRRALDLDPTVNSRFPADEAFRARLTEAARHATDLANAAPNPDRVLLASRLSEWAAANSAR